MKPMIAWCYYCERRIVWLWYKREWGTTKSSGIKNVWVCPLSDDCYHQPVPAKTDVLRKAGRV